MPDDVHPQIRSMMEKARQIGLPKVQDLTTEAARDLFERLGAARRAEFPPPEVASVENTTTGLGFGHVPVRIYQGAVAEQTPAIVFFHGGGHVIGSLETHDTVARYLALAAACTVISADYRMGPEHPFPAAVEDAFDATRWVVAHARQLGIDPAKVAVCGDSAGGNLAAVVALMARDAGVFELCAQVLVYPVIDYRGGTPTHARYGEGYGVLETATVDWFMARYLPDPADRDDWRAVPRNANSLANIAPALVLAAECDVLSEEVRAYAASLRSAGNPVTYLEFEGMTHGFFSYLGQVDDAERAHRVVASFLKDIWA